MATLALPESLRTTLVEHRRAQAAERAAAAVWIRDDLVFTTTAGTPLEPRNVNRVFEALLDRAGLRRIRLHDLRHSAASFLLEEGVDLKIIQVTLRHSRLSTTADLYTHVQPELQRIAADRMDGLLTKIDHARSGTTRRATGSGADLLLHALLHEPAANGESRHQPEKPQVRGRARQDSNLQPLDP